MVKRAGRARRRSANDELLRRLLLRLRVEDRAAFDALIRLVTGAIPKGCKKVYKP